MVTAAAAFAQNSPAPEFEVATIRPSAVGPQNAVTAGVHIDGAQARCVSLTLKDYIGIAYRIKLYQISGPDWIGSDRFDISATLPSGDSDQPVHRNDAAADRGKVPDQDAPREERLPGLRAGGRQRRAENAGKRSRPQRRGPQGSRECLGRRLGPGHFRQSGARIFLYLCE